MPKRLFVALIIGHLVMAGVGSQWSGLGYDNFLQSPFYGTYI
jgi:hypothetical protein